MSAQEQLLLKLISQSWLVVNDVTSGIYDCFSTVFPTLVSLFLSLLS